MYYNFLIIFLCYNIQQVFTLYDLPEYIHPCNDLSDECFTKATTEAIPGIVKGIPDIGLPSLDPLIIDHNVSLTLPGNLNLTFYNGRITGLRTCHPNLVSSHRENKTFIIDVHCNLTVKGLYGLRGRFLVFNMDTDGYAKIKIVRQHLHIEVSQKIVKKPDGSIHYKLDSYTYKANYGDDMKLNLTNLIRNSPELSASVLQFINANSKQLSGDFGAPILKFAIDYSMRVTQKFFDAYPYDQLVHVPFDERFVIEE